MEGRNIKKYKRNIKKEEYNPPFSNQFDNLNNHDKLSFDFDINIIKNKKIYKKIEKLPEEIRKYIYIFAMKKYWKDNLLNNSLKPFWIDYSQYINKELWKCVSNNIHFLHLEFNTLEKNKKWIPGCQCNYCINYNNHLEKEIIYNKLLKNPKYINEIVQGDLYNSEFEYYHYFNPYLELEPPTPTNFII